MGICESAANACLIAVLPQSAQARVVKSVLVTGASTGIGQACALHLDRLGHRVYAGVRNEPDAQGLRERGSGRIVPVMLDVTDQAKVDAVAKQIAGHASGLDGLVNNAGIIRGGPVEYLPVAEWREQLEVNVIGQVAVTKAVLPLIRSAGGRVVFIGSISGKLATMMLGPYCASKFALEAIGESLRQELHPWRISVSIVEPGAVKTVMMDKTRQVADRLDRDLPAEARTRYAGHIAALRKFIDVQERRGADAEKVAKAIEHALFSQRPKARYVVGSDARVGGALIRWLPGRPREAIIRRIAGP
jgi:NAD(P)-dependent dehydrogenase (short-subunit alcohol dehydrogenase family)